MKENKNSIEYWYPKIVDIVPTPKTAIIPVKRKWDKTGEYIYVIVEDVKKIFKTAIENFTFPIFLRGSDSSIKHGWKDTCFVKCKEDLVSHIQKISHETECLDVFSSIPLTAFAVREYIEMDSRFKYFYGELPINPEQRFFIYNHKIICHHPYWTSESIEDKKYEQLLGEMNTLTDEEKNLLNNYTAEIASRFDGYWSIDFCRAKDKQWYCIDMADGYRSWHPECNFKLKSPDER